MWHNTLNGRRNVWDVFMAWKAGKPKTNGAISTDGETIYSYSTAILARTRKGLIFNATKYSKTTSVHQGGIREGLRRSVKPISHEVRGCGRGMSPERLVKRVAEMAAVTR